MSEIPPEAEAFQREVGALRDRLSETIVGQEEAVRCAVYALVLGGHVLLEGMPGLGKTELVKSLAAALDCRPSRIQFTPDLMPADILGTTVVAEDGAGVRVFRFQQGPIFAHITLADEINRASPKTQAALLEAMQEAQVTIAATRHPLPAPFFVLATQNPIELEGTFPLPEAQLDRFLFKCAMAPQGEDDLVEILRRTERETAPPDRSPLLSPARLLELRAVAAQVVVPESVMRYAARLAIATRPEAEEAPAEVRRYVRYGASPRGAQALLRAARVHALLDGRPSVAARDLRVNAAPALRHRVVLGFDAHADRVAADAIIDRVLAAVRAPEGA